ncbi:hypothetical protein Bp8pS_015 [Bacillus phage vB_BpuM-BpSp]|nr:hypothetical protein Bp8pS_015 [Bacillus phage vB_BpuM-BpSp]
MIFVTTGKDYLKHIEIIKTNKKENNIENFNDYSFKKILLSKLNNSMEGNQNERN